jgi:hypothetical protein
MARHEWVRERLENWARWHEQSGRKALGYPRASAFTRLTPGSTDSDSNHVPVDDVVARATDDAVQALRPKTPHLWLVLQCRYLGDPRNALKVRGGPLSVNDTARAMCIAVSTYYAHMNDALDRLALALSGR